MKVGGERREKAARPTHSKVRLYDLCKIHSCMSHFSVGFKKPSVAGNASLSKPRHAAKSYTMCWLPACFANAYTYLSLQFQ